ncbi:MAG: GyrI-like domain-containing protein [Pseudomonadota bacterium]
MRNLGSDTVSLNELSNVAGLSKYHFSRVFFDRCKETPIEYLVRIRMEQSVSNLIFHLHIPITSIAMDAGFSSSQAYSNAFARRFGISPKKFRRKNQLYVREFPKNQYVVSPTMATLPRLDGKHVPDQPVELQHIPAMRLAYIRHRGAYYRAFYEKRVLIFKLIDWAKQNGIWHDQSKIFSVCPDNPAVTPPEFCQHDFGIVVEHGVEEDEFISIQEFPEMTLAKLRVIGTSNEARRAWRWLISEWLPNSPFTISSHNYFEIYDSTEEIFDGLAKTGTLCIPVKRRQRI